MIWPPLTNDPKFLVCALVFQFIQFLLIFYLYRGHANVYGKRQLLAIAE